MRQNLRLVFWETTRACNLGCPHCRASARPERLPDELITEEAKKFIRDIASFSKPILVFSGGEPLLRQDLYELISYANDEGLKPAVATNACLITGRVATDLKRCGIKVAAVSIYGSTPKAHDDFCGRHDAFEKTLEGIENLKRAKVPLQINATITKKNLSELEEIGYFALRQGAVSYHPFFLVPTGRGKSMAGDEISPSEYEEAFDRLYDLKSKIPIHIKVTCAPHYYRYLRQRGLRDTKGCLAGQGVSFISYKAEVFGCGYLTIPAGDLRKDDFRTIWFESELFKSLRDESKLEGKCGACEYKFVCSGCRARAFASTGDYLKEEPNCSYEPLNARY